MGLICPVSWTTSTQGWSFSMKWRAIDWKPLALFVRTERDSQKNKRWASELRWANMNSKVAQKDDLAFCLWQDTKAVIVLTNYDDLTEKGSVKRGKQECNQSGGSTASLPFRPPKTHEWCGCAGSDGWYQYQHRSKKWWRMLFFLLAVGC